MIVNCFACGKDIGVSTERRSFSGERPSESKLRVLHDWRSMVQEELFLKADIHGSTSADLSPATQMNIP